MRPTASERNLTPISMALPTVAAATPGVAELGQIQNVFCAGGGAVAAFTVTVTAAGVVPPLFDAVR